MCSRCKPFYFFQHFFHEFINYKNQTFSIGVDWRRLAFICLFLMLQKLIASVVFLVSLKCYPVQAQLHLDSLLPIRGFAIAAPPPSYVDSFTDFIENELAPRHVNLLILRVDYNYEYTSHPELRDSMALSESNVKKIVNSCRRYNIRIIPK